MKHKSRTQSEHHDRAHSLLKGAGMKMSAGKNPIAKVIEKAIHKHEAHLHHGEAPTKYAKGGGVKGARDLKPALYDAVVAGCEEAVKNAGKGAPKAAAAAPKAAAAAAPKAATVVEDDLGGPVDTSGASAETASEDGPPEGGSGEDA